MSPVLGSGCPPLSGKAEKSIKKVDSGGRESGTCSISVLFSEQVKVRMTSSSDRKYLAVKENLDIINLHC